LFAPFLTPFTNFVKKIIPDKENEALDIAIDQLDPSKATPINVDSYISAVQ
jgi:hypothetical protein